MDKLQILQYRLSVKQRLLKLKRTPSFYFLLGLLSLAILIIIINKQPWVKDQYYKISLTIIKTAEKPLRYWHEMKNSFSMPNQSLIKELDKAKYLNHVLSISLIELRQENNLLKQNMHYQSTDFDHFITTSVIGTKSINRHQYVFAKIGTKQGVQIACPVLNQNFIIGIVDQVTISTCRISLISNPLSRVPVYVLHPDQEGIITGNDDVLLRLALKDSHTVCKPGDAVFTSGLGGIYPAHKMIGRINRVSNQGITVKPTVSTKSTDLIQIIIPSHYQLPVTP